MGQERGAAARRKAWVAGDVKADSDLDAGRRNVTYIEVRLYLFPSLHPKNVTYPLP